MLALPVAANAQVAYTAKTVHLRAGPARDYPVVAILGSGLAVTIQGCMRDYSWCDVIAGEYRGWVYAGNIVHSYQGANVPVIDYGGAIGIGVVTFVIGSSWHDHYIGRPWYRQTPQWSHRLPRAAINPRPPHGTVHPGGAQRPVPAQRNPRRPPSAGVAPRQPQAGARPQGGRRPAPAYRPAQRPAGAGANPRPPQGATHAGRERRPTHGPAQGARPRQ
ncbi:MAG: SH3 domain-containing protein [Burkholderiales bacterium]